MKRLPDKPENPSDPRKVSVVLLKEENSYWSPCPGIGDTNLNEKDFVSESHQKLTFQPSGSLGSSTQSLPTTAFVESVFATTFPLPKFTFTPGIPVDKNSSMASIISTAMVPAFSRFSLQELHWQ